jgi:prepilin-type N-terminal cleavage/methylation domain-containing protein
MRFERKRLKRSSVGDAAFTLIELLVVMAIAGILITVGLTAGSSLTQRAKAQKCVKNLKGMGTALMAYVQDNGGAIPGAVTGQGQKSHPLIELVKYAGSPDVMLCPSDRDASTFSWEDDSAVAASSERYGWNGNPCKKGCSYMYHAALMQMPTGQGGGDLVLPVNLSAIEEPSRVMVLMDGSKAISPLDWGGDPATEEGIKTRDFLKDYGHTRSRRDVAMLFLDGSARVVDTLWDSTKGKTPPVNPFTQATTGSSSGTGGSGGTGGARP